MVPESTLPKMYNSHLLSIIGWKRLEVEHQKKEYVYLWWSVIECIVYPCSWYRGLNDLYNQKWFRIIAGITYISVYVILNPLFEKLFITRLTSGIQARARRNIIGVRDVRSTIIVLWNAILYTLICAYRRCMKFWDVLQWHMTRTFW